MARASVYVWPWLQAFASAQEWEPVPQVPIARISEALGISLNVLYGMRTGKRAASPERAIAIAETLNVPRAHVLPPGPHNGLNEYKSPREYTYEQRRAIIGAIQAGGARSPAKPKRGGRALEPKA